MMKVILGLALVAGIAAGANGWIERDDPTLMGTNYEYHLSKLPTSGHIKTSAWSETYWPSYRGGIACRWNSDDEEGFNYHLYNKTELLTLNSTAFMSPAEKFDIYNARYDYPTVQTEWSRCSPDDPSWEGICHGWSPAALSYIQPNPVTLKNPDGIKVRFGASDIKALLSYYMGQYDSSASTKFVGERCDIDLDDHPENSDDDECFDMNPGAWHIILANEIGVNKRGYVIDRTRDQQVWNQPMNGYTTNISHRLPPRENATAGTAHSYHVVTTFTYSKELSPRWYPEPEPYTIDEDYEYYLDVDKHGKIIGGVQITWDRTDFLWMQTPDPFFGYFGKLKEIYKAGIKKPAETEPPAVPADPVTPTPTQPEATTAAPDTAAPAPPEATTAAPAMIDLLEGDVCEDHLLAPTHEVLTGPEGRFGISNYANNEHRSWTLKAPRDDMEIAIVFENVDTEKAFDMISVYEGPKGFGPLVAVLHGKQQGKSVRVKASEALVVFRADGQHTAQGFSAKYKFVSDA